MIHQLYRQTDGQTTCVSKTALCSVVHRAVKTKQSPQHRTYRTPPPIKNSGYARAIKDNTGYGHANTDKHGRMHARIGLHTIIISCMYSCRNPYRKAMMCMQMLTDDDQTTICTLIGCLWTTLNASFALLEIPRTVLRVPTHRITRMNNVVTFL